MKIWYLFLALMIVSLNVFTQRTVRSNGNPFGVLHFKNGIATITIKARIIDLHRDATMIKAKNLTPKQKKEFGPIYNQILKIKYTNSAISFVSAQDNDLQEAPLAASANFKDEYSGKIVRLTCTVFENAPYMRTYSKYFFVINGVSMHAEDNPPVASIAPFQYVDGLRYPDAVAIYYTITPEFFDKGKAVVIMPGEDEAAIKNQDGNLLTFKRSKRVLTSTGYIDYFSGDSGAFELAINRVVSDQNHYSYHFGHLTVKLKSANLSLDVFGEDREKDKFNEY